MPSDALVALKAELTEAVNDIEPRIEGLKDFARLNLLPKTAPVVDATLKAYQRRLDALNRVLREIGQLEADAYPGLPTVEVEADVYTDLKSNVDTIAAAFAKFATASAEVVTIVPGVPEQK